MQVGLLSFRWGIMSIAPTYTMAFDRNPKFGKDQSFAEGARRVTDLLWETTGGNLSQFPKTYLESLRYSFSDGNVSMLELIDRVNLGPDATYEQYCEVVDALLSVDSSLWPNPDSVVEVPACNLEFAIEPDFDFSEFDFADEVEGGATGVESPESQGSATPQPDPTSQKMVLFFKKVISSVYLDGVTEVTDLQGNPPNASNNYLLSEDGKQFSGVFYDTPPNDEAKKFPFVISETETGTWQIKY